jgi:hypothetical protein
VAGATGYLRSAPPGLFKVGSAGFI